MSEVLRSDQLKVVERLVGMRAKIKFIDSMVGSSNGGKAARDIYKRLNESPPVGMPGGASSTKLRLPELMSFTAMAVRYIKIRRFGVPQLEASLAVFASAYQGRQLHNLGSVNRWLGLARDIDAGNAGLFKCRHCFGNHLWQAGVLREYRACIWCGEKVTMSPAALKAMFDCESSLKQRRVDTNLHSLTHGFNANPQRLRPAWSPSSLATLG